MNVCFPKFDICYGTVVPGYFKSNTNSWCPDARSEIHLVQRNIVSTGQSVRVYKNYNRKNVLLNWSKSFFLVL